ncbi:MAG: thiamine diphosphokinase [Clostridia bacterium]|nr:thiamine diphosphokinase [Clostridia bacterium]
MRCIIIAGSPETNPDFIKQAVLKDDYIICADRGYHYAKLACVTPNLLVGDFDSCDDPLPKDCETVTLIPEKDDTDTEHCVKLALQKGFDDIVILGATGGRLDHTLANMALLLYIANKGAKGVLLSKYEKVLLLTQGEYSFENLCGKTFSLFPFGCYKVCVSYSGAKYPLDKKYVTSDTSLGVSNVFFENICKINIYDGNAILVINFYNC